MTLPAETVDARLETYAELRAQGHTRLECAKRIGISRPGLEWFLKHHQDDPRSDWGCLRPEARTSPRAPSSIGLAPEVIRAAQLAVCARLDPPAARLVLEILGIGDAA